MEDEQNLRKEGNVQWFEQKQQDGNPLAEYARSHFRAQPTQQTCTHSIFGTGFIRPGSEQRFDDAPGLDLVHVTFPEVLGIDGRIVTGAFRRDVILLSD